MLVGRATSWTSRDQEGRLRLVPNGKSPKFLMIPDDTASGDVRALLSLTAEQMRALDRALGDKTILKARGRAPQLVAEQLSIGQEAAVAAMSAVINLRRQRGKYALTDDQLVDDLQVVTTNELASVREALLHLLQTSEEDYVVEKVSSLRHALGPHLVDARTVVDLRPVFSKDRSSVEGMLVVTFLELTTHEIPGDRYDSYRVQLSEGDIADLRQKLDDAERKIARLKTELPNTELFQ